MVLLALLIVPPAQAGQSEWTSLNGLTAGSGAQHIRAFAYDNVPPTTVYAATDDQGVFRSLNAGVSWSPFNNGLDNLQAKTVRALLVEGTTVYAGTNLGVFTSEGGSAWEPLAQGTEQNPAQPKNLNEPVQSLISLPGNVILAGVFSGGVYKSTDGGETWTHPPPGNGMPAHQTVTGLSAHPFTGGLVYAASGTGLYRSTNSGSTWTLASDGIPGSAGPNLLWVDPNRPNTHYVGTTASGVYRSINAGVTWSEINDGLGAVRARGLQIFTNSQGAVLYAATENALWAGQTRGSTPPSEPKWRDVTTEGLIEPQPNPASNTIMWALTAPVFPAGPDRKLLAGTGSNGGYEITLERPDNPCPTPPGNSAPCPVTLDATPVEGQVLQATKGTQWSGTETIDFAFAWQSCPASPPNPDADDCTDIDNETDDKYVVTQADDDADRRFRIEITATNSFPTLTEVKRFSAATGPAGPNPANFPGSQDTWQPDVDVVPPGPPDVGDTLRADEGKSPDPPTDDGWFEPPAATRAYQWLRCKDFSDNDCIEVPGATGRDYVLRTDDGQHSMRVRVTGTNPSGTNQLLSPGTFLVISEQATPTENPQIFGDAYPGETLSGTVGAWKDPTTVYERLWLRCDANGDFCTDIQEIPSGDPETGPSYTVREGDVGYTLRMRVTADVNGDTVDGELPAAFETHTPPSSVVAVRPSSGGPPGGDGLPGGGLGPGTGGPGDILAPTLTAFSLTNKRFVVGSAATATVAGRRTPKGTTFRFRLSEPATATLTIERKLAGRKVGRKCKTPTRKLRKRKKCTRLKRAGTLTRRNLAAGAQAVPFSGRIGKKKLAPGSYQVKVVGTDAAGNKSRAATAAFTVVRR